MGSNPTPSAVLLVLCLLAAGCRRQAEVVVDNGVTYAPVPGWKLDQRRRCGGPAHACVIATMRDPVSNSVISLAVADALPGSHRELLAAHAMAARETAARMNGSKKTHGAAVVASEAFSLGGLPAMVAKTSAYRGPSRAMPTYTANYSALGARRTFLVTYSASPGYERQQTALLDSFLASLAFDDKPQGAP